MRKLAMVLNAVVVVFFVGFLAYSVIARQHLESLAREFVVEKTLEYAGPLVEVAEASLESPLAKKLLSDDQANAIRSEITAYHADPSRYITDLAEGKKDAAPIENPNPLLQKVAAIKDKVRTFYDDTLNALITDLRVFSCSNLIAGLIALALAYCSPGEIRTRILLLSLVVFVAVLYCSYLYIDDLTFFRILFRTHLGWGYAIVLCVAIVSVYRDYVRHLPEEEGKAVAGKPASIDAD